MSVRNNTASATALTADRELVISRVFEAPRELVWRAWTEPQHIVKWWGPRGFTTTIEVMDVRPGGEWRHVMHGPDGTKYPNHTTFREVRKPERIVFTNTGGKTKQDVQFESTWTFEDFARKTRVTIRMVFATAQECVRVAREYGAVQGGHQTLARLSEFLQAFEAELEPPTNCRQKNEQMALTEQELVLAREFNAPRALVWKAWTEAKHLAQWWGPRGYQNPVCEVDARAGGAFVIHMQAPDGTISPLEGEFKQVEEPERLVFTERLVSMYVAGNEPDLLFELLNTIALTEHRGKTRVEVRSQVVRGSALTDGMAAGWEECLERLEAFLTTNGVLE